MGDNSSDRRGRWVYQNLRWHYLPDDGAPESSARERVEPAPALSSLVDTRRLVDLVSRWSSASGCPALVCAMDDGGDTCCAIGGPASREDLQAFALRCARDDRVLGSDDPGEEDLLAVPVRLEWCGVSRVRIVVVAHLPREMDRREAHIGQLIGVVDSYGAWVVQVLELRQELAKLRGRNRSLMVRVESVEKRLVESCSEPVLRLDEEGTVFEDGILAQILELPNLGIVVERCSDHRVLYMNSNLRRRFGDRVGELCFNVFRGVREPCDPDDCPMEVLFREGAPPVTTHLAYDRENGLHYEVFAVPLIGRDGSRQVLEIGVDVTRLVQKASDAEAVWAGDGASTPAK
ncbi:MAG: PAS domain-containing protein [Pseudomonadota bacterium]